MPHTFAFFANVWASAGHHIVTARLVTVKRVLPDYSDRVTKDLHRFYGANDLHFITCSCYRTQALLTPPRRDLWLQILEETRRKYRFVVHGYVVMPEHFHLLVTEPEIGNPSVVMKVIKERFSRQLNRRRNSAARRPLFEVPTAPFWQRRFYDFNVWSERKRIEKLRYIHRNPVKRGLVERPEQWKWSSFRAYAFGEPGIVKVNAQEWLLQARRRPVASFGEAGQSHPLIRKKRE